MDEFFAVVFFGVALGVAWLIVKVADETKWGRDENEGK
jgi:hypothetical protein